MGIWCCKKGIDLVAFEAEAREGDGVPTALGQGALISVDNPQKNVFRDF